MIREPIFKSTPLSELHPTQMSVGMREVKTKRQHWRAKHGDQAGTFLASHMTPVVLGPDEHPYVIDHHHLARALHEEGVKSIGTTVVANLSRLEKDAFWIFLDNRGWMHPFDDEGHRRDYDDLPRSIDGLIDDPFRSLAGEVRRNGGFAKDVTPFSEFLWADFLRRRIERKAVESDFDRTLDKALRLARSHDADFLPGWCGSTEE
jgi:hypothetical protein